MLKGSSETILEIATEKWNDKTQLNLINFGISQSFKYHHLRYKDTYLKYIRFRTLHHRFYTNDLLHKMGIKHSNLCTFCAEQQDSVSHMLLFCSKSKSIDLWRSVRTWIQDLGMDNYNLSVERIILGDPQNATCINTIILLTKKTIYDAMKRNNNPIFSPLKMTSKTFIFLKNTDLMSKERVDSLRNNIRY